MIDHLLQPLVCERFMTDARYREGHLRVEIYFRFVYCRFVFVRQFSGTMQRPNNRHQHYYPIEYKHLADVLDYDGVCSSQRVFPTPQPPQATFSATLYRRDKERQIQILICPHIAIDLWQRLPRPMQNKYISLWRMIIAESVSTLQN